MKNTQCKFCKLLKEVSIPAFSFISKIYIFIFARPNLQFLNNILLQLALRGHGFNNCCHPKKTGEELLIRKILKFNPSLCIDVGANTGLYTETLLSLTKARVVSFEPLPVAFKKLQKLKDKFPDRVTLINEGVGDKQAMLKLYHGKPDSELASFCPESNQIKYVGEENKSHTVVPVTTLDHFFLSGEIKNKEIDLLKIDTEGYEYEVLLGAAQTIKILRPKFIQIEFNWHQLFRCHTMFLIGSLLPKYKCYQLLPYGSGLIERDIKRPEANIFYYSNYVFVRDDITL